MSAAENSTFCYCPSRWLMAHHDSQANIQTMSSHMCLADLNNDGENLLAMIDFKPRFCQDQPTKGEQNFTRLAPYDCRLRVYRGQQLMYNHFLDDLPSCLIAASIRAPTIVSSSSSIKTSQLLSLHRPLNQLTQDNKLTDNQLDRLLLAIPINDDVYFYHKLRPSHKLSLEDDPSIIENLFNKSELEIWQMVKENKVKDLNVLRELLESLANELNPEELSSHTNNFLALKTLDERKNYLLSWKFKKLTNLSQEQLMSMDTISCMAARLKFSSQVTRSGDFGQTRDTNLNNNEFSFSSINNAKYSKILDIQKDGLILGTEDRNLLIYELRLNKTYLEYHYKLPSVPDHLLVERRLPSSFDLSKCDNLRSLTYKILISCRNSKIYLMDQKYLIDKKTSGDSKLVRELISLKCNVSAMTWSGQNETSVLDGMSYPNFIVACLDRRVYCFSTYLAQCKWSIELDSPITSIISLPMPNRESSATLSTENNLIGVASIANRIDFYISSSGRIVDSIYFSAQNDYCQSMTFGRFGREDNCLCLTTKLGHLIIFILKRTAKFAHGQCLSSAATYALRVINQCGHYLIENVHKKPDESNQGQDNSRVSQRTALNEPTSVPSAFNLTKSSLLIEKKEQNLMDLLQSTADHNCLEGNDQLPNLTKEMLDSYLRPQLLQIPAKSKDFVDHIVQQSRNSTAITNTFARHMTKLRDKIKLNLEQQTDLKLDTNREAGNSVNLTKITGLGNTYRVSLSLRLNLKRYAIQSGRLQDNHLLEGDQQRENLSGNDRSVKQSLAAVFLFLTDDEHRPSMTSHDNKLNQLMPFRVNLFDTDIEKKEWILEKTIEFKLLTNCSTTLSNGLNQLAVKETVPVGPEASQLGSESMSVQLLVLLGAYFKSANSEQIQRPVFISSVNIPTG